MQIRWGRKTVSLASVVLQQPGKLVDHIDRNPFNNQKSNLRRVTFQQNVMNRGKYAKASSRYKGVGWFKKYKKWRAGIALNDRYYHLGYFTDEKAAALAYNNKAKELFGEYAFLNDLS